MLTTGRVWREKGLPVPSSQTTIFWGGCTLGRGTQMRRPVRPPRDAGTVSVTDGCCCCIIFINNRSYTADRYYSILHVRASLVNRVHAFILSLPPSFDTLVNSFRIPGLFLVWFLQFLRASRFSSGSPGRACWGWGRRAAPL